MTHDLLGRSLVAAGGMAAGQVCDLIVDLQSGMVTQLPVTDSGSKVKRVLPWNVIADLFLERAIVLRTASRQVPALPEAAGPTAGAPPARISGKES